VGSQILDGVVDGERVIVTRHGHPIAVILSIEQAVDLFPEQLGGVRPDAVAGPHGA